MSAAILNHLWQSTLCVGVAALLVWVCRKAGAHVRYGIWLAASLKFLVPFALLATLGSSIGWPAPAGSIGAYLDIAQSIAAPASGASEAPAQVVTYLSTPASIGLFPYLLLAWALGSMMLTIRWLMRWNAARTIVNAASPAASDAPLAVRITTASIEPGVFGILRPTLLLPATLFELLRPEQLRGVIAHETAHVRRHDNLTAAAHTVTEILFWFHPLVWWLGARLVTERERACDEAVIRAGEDRRAYAQAILSVCRLYLGAPIVSASGASGGHLRTRMEAILREPLSSPLGPAGRGLLIAMTTLAVAGPIALGAESSARANTAGEAIAAPRVKFSRVRILRGQDSHTSVVNEFPDHFVAQNSTVRQLIRFAYDQPPSLISGGPGWIDTDRYTVLADIDAHDAVAGKSAHQLTQERVRSLLADRFRLRARIAKEPVYILESADDAPEHAHDPVEKGKGIALFERHGDDIRVRGASSASITDALSKHLSHKVLDHTKPGVTYDFQGKWPRDVSALGDALHAQAGLTLKSFTIEQLVIDGAEHPKLDSAANSPEQVAAIR